MSAGPGRGSSVAAAGRRWSRSSPTRRWRRRELRRMTQITGHAEFCEMFLDKVRVPKANLLSQRGDGWKIAMYTLGHERGTAALPRQVKLRTWLDRLVRVAADRQVDGRPILED